MNDITLTVAVAGHFYYGSAGQWRTYIHALIDGKITRYRRSLLYGNQSMAGFVDYFRRNWSSKTPLPEPEDHGLIKLQPANVTQTELINELLKEAA